jgi:hypothetical protein
MKRIKCKACGYAVVPKEGHCPYCGAAIQNVKIYALKLMLFVSVIISILVLINVLSDNV